MQKWMKYILFVGLLLRFFIYAQLMLSNPSAIYDPDSEGYTVIGHALAKGDFLVTQVEAKEATVFRVVGYPAFLSIFYALGFNDIMISFIQLLLDVLNVYLIYSISKTLFKSDKNNEKIGYAAALFYSISPLFISFFFKILTETLFTTVLLGALYLYLDNKKYHSSILLGLLILIKPVALFYPFAFAAYNYLSTKDKKQSLVLLLLPLCISSIWLIRNYAVFNKITYSGITTLNYVCWNSVYLANELGIDNPKWGDFIKEHKLESFEGCQKKNFSDVEKEVPEINRFVIANLPLYVKQYVKGAITFFAPTTPNNLLKALGKGDQAISLTYFYLKKGFDLSQITESIIKNKEYAIIFILSLTYHLVVYVLFVFGLINIYKDKNYSLLLLIVVLILYNIVAVGPIANYRFRIPVEPFILLVGAYGINTEKIRKFKG